MNGDGRLPDFLVIGAMKSGTTSLEHYLDQHPQVFMTRLKEPNYFAFRGQAMTFKDAFGRPSRLNVRSVTSPEDYRNLFDRAEPSQRAGEISHWYLYHPAAAKRISEEVPDVRLIAVLRNPIERAYSEFLFHRRDGREPVEDFESALDLEPDRIAAGCDDGRYVDRGLYYQQLTRYFALFPREQLKVFLFEDLLSNPGSLIRELYEHIRVDSSIRADTSVSRNISGIPRSPAIHRVMQTILWQEGAREAIRPTPLGRSLQRLNHRVARWNLRRPPLEPRLRERLKATFTTEVVLLQGLIGRDLSAWLNE